MDDLLAFVLEKHKDQKRKYTGELYVYHLLEVAQIVSGYLHHFPQHMHWRMMADSLLHDVMEDQGVTFDELTERFGVGVASDVVFLSDLNGGNRAERNKLARVRLGSAPPHVQTIKCADLISNTKSIVQHDHGFAINYLKEKRDLLSVLKEAQPDIHQRATELAVCPLCQNTQILKRWWRVSACRCVHA